VSGNKWAIVAFTIGAIGWLIWWRNRAPAGTVEIIDGAAVPDFFESPDFSTITAPVINFLDDIGMTTKPRGIRNNNPGNIRDNGTNWQGRIGGDGAYVIFDTPENGIRAMTRVLMSYQARGIDTVREIIYTWAPPSENNTAAYMQAVASAMGVDPDTIITRASWLALVKAIIRHENGQQPYLDSTIVNGINAA